MRPKGKLFALLVIFVAIGLVTATGAFTSVEATRTAEVNVAGDAAALLQLQPEPGANGLGNAAVGSSEGYADLQSNELVINLGGFGNSADLGSGPNLNATTDIQAVFNVTNQGTQEVNVSFSDNGTHNAQVTFYDATGTHGDAKTAGGLESGSATLGIGDTLVVSIYIDTTSITPSAGDALIDSVTINATATA